MKQLFGILILINVSYLLYQQVFADKTQAPASNSMITADVIDPKGVQGSEASGGLVRPAAFPSVGTMTVGTMTIVAAQTNSQNPQRAIGAATSELVERRLNRSEAVADPKVCASMGPFGAKATAADLAQRLRKLGIEVQLSEREMNAAPDYLVYVGPQPSRSAARRLMTQFQAQALEAHIISAGRLENALSLGVFTRQPLALALQQKLKERGFDAKIGPLKRQRRGYQVSAELPQSLRAELVDDGISVQECAPA